MLIIQVVKIMLVISSLPYIFSPKYQMFSFKTYVDFNCH